MAFDEKKVEEVAKDYTAAAKKIDNLGIRYRADLQTHLAATSGPPSTVSGLKESIGNLADFGEKMIDVPEKIDQRDQTSRVK